MEAPPASPSPATPITAADAQLAIKRGPNWGCMSATEVGSLCSPSTPGSWTPDNSPPCEEKENASGSHNLQSGALHSSALQSCALAPSPPPAHASEGVPALNLNVKLNGTVKAPLEVSSGGLSSGGLTTPSLKLVGFSEADPSTIEPRFASPLSPFSKRPFVSYELRVGLPHSGGECGWSVHRRFSQFVTLAEERKALDATSLKQCRAEQMLPSRLRLPSTLAIEASERISGLQASVSYEDLDCAYVVSPCASHAPHFCTPVCPIHVPSSFRVRISPESHKPGVPRRARRRDFARCFGSIRELCGRVGGAAAQSAMASGHRGAAESLSLLESARQRPHSGFRVRPGNSSRLSILRQDLRRRFRARVFSQRLISM